MEQEISFIKKLIKKFFESQRKYNERINEALLITRSVKTNYKCPKCKKELYRLQYSKAVDPRFFCKNCKYKGTLGI